ncbi:MAG: hypothetical protein ACM3ZB_10020 [bacterium]|jgi:alpha-beta hydrolase superfamily lysophospholipase
MAAKRGAPRAPELHHEPHNERERLEVLDYVAEWIEQRAGRR